MPSNDLLASVDRLVTVATQMPDDKALRRAVNAVVSGFDARDARTARAAVARLGAGLAEADGRAIQVLYLTLGALVEAGAPPDAAWKVVGDGLAPVLARATRFARACVDRAGAESDLDEAFVAVAADVAAERPKDAAAWREVSARCLAAVACLARARKARIAAAADAKLRAALEPLSEAVDEVGLLLELLGVLDSASITVLHAPSRRGLRVQVRDLASNVELVVLVAGALDAKAARPKGKTLKTKLDPIAWTSVGPDGGIPEPTDHDHDHDHDHDDDPHSILEGSPAAIPTLHGERVVVLRELWKPRALPTEPAIPGLEPEVRVVASLKPAEVESLFAAIARAAKKAPARKSTAKDAPARAAPPEKAPAKPAKRPTTAPPKKATASPPKRPPAPPKRAPKRR